MSLRSILTLFTASALLVMPWMAASVEAQNLVQLSPINSSTSTDAYNDAVGSEMALRGRVSTVPKGTNLLVKLDQPVSSFSNHLGDPITGTLENDVFLNDAVAIPAGSEVVGQVTAVSPSGRMGKHGEVEVRFFSIKTPDNNSIPIRAHIVTKDDTGVLKGNSYTKDLLTGVAIAGGATGIGALLGTATFGVLEGVSAGTGAALGTGVGGIVGLTYAVARKGKDVVIPTGSRLSLLLDQSVSVNP
ncbi:MAG: hypothetical protein SFZ03_02995 [Candidatus Melainabacteria bacterium]|nr:hypothetical protein [Candidatus Melainabacteria bacterium]